MSYLVSTFTWTSTYNSNWNWTYALISLQGQLRKSARKPPAKESGKLKGYFQRLKEEKERRRVS